MSSLISQIESYLPDNIHIDSKLILEDLYKLLSKVLYDADTPLRDIVEFISTENVLPQANKYWLVFRGGIVEYTTLDKTEFKATFRGSVKKGCTREELVSYVKDVVYGYVENESNLVNFFAYYKNDFDTFFNGNVHLANKKEPRFKGIYLDHRINFHEDLANMRVDIFCDSKIAFFVD